MSAKANFHNPWLYVADTLDSVIYVYELRKFGAIKIGEITEGSVRQVPDKLRLVTSIRAGSSVYALAPLP